MVITSCKIPGCVSLLLLVLAIIAYSLAEGKQLFQGRRAIAFGFKFLSDCHSEEQSDEESRCCD